MTADQKTSIVNAANGITALLTINAADAPADIKADAALAAALKALGVAVTSRFGEAGLGDVWHPS